VDVPGIDTSRPNIARVYDYLLGGKDNYQADRDLAEQLADPDTGYAGVKDLARTNRRFVTGAVTWAASRGVGQFLDAGAGLPTRPAVHQTARASLPGARVVYLDCDPVAVLHAQALLARPDGVAAVRGDLTDPGAVLADERVRLVIDLAEPLAVILGAVLHFQPAGTAGRIVARFMEPLPPGSMCVISVIHYEDPELCKRLSAQYAAAGYLHNHTAADVDEWFAGARLRIARGHAGDVRLWPMTPNPSNEPAFMIGGVGVKSC
jgi:O-methyltransferase involved in polyketide biosynthesis